MEIPQSVQEILCRLERQGYEAWCVGGCVRDLLLGKAPQDWDVTTSALPHETMALFGPKALPTGLRHGTVTVQPGVEVTTFRVDGAYLDHRRPEQVAFTHSLEEDLSRRDFTVNAMALDLNGQLRDPFGGRADLEAGLLRCVGQAQRRLDEDALRILRGLRFAAVLGFSIEPSTAQAIHRCAPLLKDIAPERIQGELFRLLCGRDAAKVLRAYPDVLGVFWPEILPMVGFDQRNRHHCYDVWEHTLHALEAVEGEVVLRCAVLLHDIGKPGTFTLDEAGNGHFYGHPAHSRDLAEDMLRRLRCANDLRQQVTRLVEWHDKPIAPEERAIRRCLRRLGEEDLRRLLAIKRADNLAQSPAYRGRQRELDTLEALLTQVLEQESCFSLRQLAVKGGDLLALGLRGPAVGAALERLLEQVIDGAVPNDKDALLTLLRREREEGPRS